METLLVGGCLLFIGGYLLFSSESLFEKLFDGALITIGIILSSYSL